jgi:electron transport complex protein RnfA
MNQEVIFLIKLFLATVFVNNVVLTKFLGICPFMGVSKKVETSIGMSFAVIFVMTVASAITWVIQTYLLEPFEITYLQTISFILVIASLVQFIEMFMQKFSPSLYNALGVFLPLITTNCAVLGIAIINIQENYSFIRTIVNGFGTACGFALALILFAGIRERLEFSDVPKSFRNLPIAFIVASLMAMAFMGFTGIISLN